MKELCFTAKADKGRIAYDLPAQAGAVAAFLTGLEGKRVEVSYREIRDVRSLAANRRYWGLIVPVAAEVLSAGRDIPLSKDMAHYVLKAAFIGVEQTPLGPFPRSSKELDVPGFKKFCDEIEGWLGSQYSVVIPDRLEDA